MVSHIFGAKDSPSCANYCLKRTADDNKKIFSEEAVKSVQEDFYVDDLLKAVETPSKAISLAHELMALLDKGGFRLTKWTSNSREVLASIPEGKRARPTVNLDLDELPIERALGILWNVERINHDVQIANKWFEDNGMKANPAKHQGMVLGKTDYPFSF